jgi:anti-anti-sigma regulatory factor
VADVLDIEAVEPTMNLTLLASSLVCNGTLNARTRPCLLDAARVLFADRPARVTIDISDVLIEDVDGANTFAHVQRMARQVGTTLHWEGLDSDRLRGILPLRTTVKRSRSSQVRMHLHGRQSPSAKLEPIA